MLGLGKMGGNMSARLIRNGVTVVGYDNNHSLVEELVTTENLIGATSIKDTLSKLDEQKIIWMMLYFKLKIHYNFKNLKYSEPIHLNYYFFLLPFLFHLYLLNYFLVVKYYRHHYCLFYSHS